MKEKLLPIQNQLLDRLNRTKEPVSSQFLANSLVFPAKRSVRTSTSSTATWPVRAPALPPRPAAATG